MASPHYGERWGRIWLDAARYADSNGYREGRTPPGLVLSRLGDPRAQSRSAVRPVRHRADCRRSAPERPRRIRSSPPAFCATRMTQRRGRRRPGTVPHGSHVRPHGCDRQRRYSASPSSARSATTTNSIRLTQEEYYRMFAFLNNSHEANIAVYTPEAADEARRDLPAHREIEAELQHRHPDWRERMAEWEGSARTTSPSGPCLRLTVDDISTGGQKYMPLPDGSFLARATPRPTTALR